MIRRLKKIFQILIHTPLHPQWLTTNKKTLIGWIETIAKGSIILDIGCFDKWPKKYLPSDTQYIGLDYYETAIDWYKSTPDIFGDIESLPIPDNTIDVILLFDVLEHIEDIEKAMNEVNRVLKENGRVFIQIPCFYPLHDEPRDFRRLTIHGLQSLAKKKGFNVEKHDYMGQPLETAALLSNLAIVKVILNGVKHKKPLTIISLIIAPFFILLSNILSKLLSIASTNDPFMPINYQIIFIKNKQSQQKKSN